MSTWLITGCSTGLGRAFAQAVLAHGRMHQGAGAIAADHLERIFVVFQIRSKAAFIADRGAHVEAAQTRFGAVDVLVNNAGYGYRAAVEEGEDGPVQQLFDTHVFGAVRMIKAVLPGMRARRSGTIVNISSIGARRSPEGSGYYSAVKAALEALTLSLRKEVEPLGITAMVVEPGGFRTDFAGRSLTQSAVPLADYADTAGKRRKENDSAHGRQKGDPAKAAAALLHAVESAHPPFMLLLGNDASDTFRSALRALSTEVDAWEALSRSTDFDD